MLLNVFIYMIEWSFLFVFNYKNVYFSFGGYFLNDLAFFRLSGRLYIYLSL